MWGLNQAPFGWESNTSTTTQSCLTAYIHLTTLSSLSHYLRADAPAQLPLEALVDHKLDGRVEHQQQGGEGAVPQCARALFTSDLHKGIWRGGGGRWMNLTNPIHQLLVIFVSIKHINVPIKVIYDALYNSKVMQENYHFKIVFWPRESKNKNKLHGLCVGVLLAYGDDY